jgi:nicotinate-nucleotide adenylyltransferase
LRRVAIFGGTFNPIHYGHLLLADEVRETLGLDRVLFVPAALPPHKSPRHLAPAHHRYAMVTLATAGNSSFAVSDIELRRAGTSYTVDTIEALRAASADELFVLIGSETFLDLLSWKDAPRLARLSRLVVVPRAGSSFDAESAQAQKVLREIGQERFVRVDDAPSGEGVLIVPATSLPISSSDLRRRARDGRSLAYRLPAPVIDYVRIEGLYRDETGENG